MRACCATKLGPEKREGKGLTRKSLSNMFTYK